MNSHKVTIILSTIISLILFLFFCSMWKAIEATQELAKSSNSKVIIIGSSKNGLPVILGGAK